MLLDIDDGLAGIGLVPAAVKLLGNGSKLDDEVAREVLGFGLATLLTPQPHECGFIMPHDDPGVRAADEVAALRASGSTQYISVHLYAPSDGTVAGFRLRTSNLGLGLTILIG